MALRFATSLLAAVGLFAASAARSGSGWIDVPFVQQQDNGCGAAATAMLMQYWRAQGFAVVGDSADAAAIYDSIYSPNARGIFGSRIEQYLQTHGFKPYVFAGGWDDLSWHLSRGRPLIVCVRNDGPGAAFHYLVVAGLDEPNGQILVNDSARRKLSRIDRRNFEQAWKASGNWTLLALPQQPQ